MRDKIIKEAYHACLKEMYAKAQPSADYDSLLEGVKNGTIIDTAIDPLYRRYYLSQDEFEYIRDKYIRAYGMRTHWRSNVSVVESYLKSGGLKTVYGKYGRDFERVPPLLILVNNILDNEDIANKVVEAVMQAIDECKNFHSFDHEELQFSASLSLGPSPNSSKEAVEEYYKSQGIDIEIAERNPLLFWERDEYGDEFEDIMREDYGDDWEAYWWRKYHENDNK